MNASTRCVLALFLLINAVMAQADPDAAIEKCRAQHADRPTEHIACLERELQALGGSPKKQAPASLGSEQLRSNRPQDTVEEVTVRIQNVSYGRDGMGLFRMADGQVWKATESTPREQRLETGKNYGARIERGKLGGYRMYVDGAPRMIRVTRVN
jgi:hypothetical protein